MSKTQQILQQSLSIIYFFWCISLKYDGLGQNQIPTFQKIPLIKNFNTDNYDGGIQNWEITQNEQDLFFIANNHGVLEFDGSFWRKNNTPVGSRILSLYADVDNRIYVGGQNQLGYFDVDNRGNFNYHSLEHLIPKEEKHIHNVWKIFKQEENIAFNTGTYTYFFDGDSITSVPTHSQGRNMFQPRSNLLFFFPKKGLFLFERNEFHLITGTKVLSNSRIMEILPTVEGGYLILENSGKIYNLKDNKIKPWNTEATHFLQQSLINTAKILSDNNIAIGTQNGGLIILEPSGKLKTHISRKKGLNSSTVYSIYQDKFKNIWLGLSNGISIIKYGSPFSIIDERLGLPGTGYAAEIHDDQLYLGTNNGLFQSPKAISFINEDSKYQKIDNSNGQVYSIDSKGKELFMGHHRGSFLIQENQAKLLNEETGFWKYETSPDGKTLIGGSYDGFYSIEVSSKSTSRIHGFPESSRYFAFDDPTTIWMSHGFKGLFKIKLSPDHARVLDQTFYGDKSGFPSNHLIKVIKLNDRTVFTGETGIYQYDASKNRFIPHSTLSPTLSHAYINTLEADHLGNIYFMKDGKMGLLKKNKFGGFDKDERLFNPINKYILNDDSENITFLNHRNVLIGAKEGFIHLNPSTPASPIHEINVLLREIWVENDSIAQIFGGNSSLSDTKSKFSSDLRSISFAYSAPYYDGFDETTYRYFLEGFDSHWSTWGSITKKEYTNLSHGNYTFKIKAKSIYGDVSPIIAYSFEIQKPWFLTNYAYVGYLTMILGLFGSALALLDRKHKYDKRRMTIDQKRAIQRKNVELITVEKASEQRITQLKNEKLLAEVDFKNKELASTTMHLLNKNEVMLDIKSKLESISKNRTPKTEEIKKIIKSITKNISEDNDWEQFTRHFDQVHGDFLKKLKSRFPDLTPQETKLAAYLRMNLTSKDVAQLLNISVRGVEISRYRLRKKLKLERETNLVSFLMEV